MVVLDHVADLQRFVRDRVVAPNELERGRVVEVLPLAPHFLVRIRKPYHRLAPAISPAISPALAASYPPLGGLERALGLAIPPRMQVACAIGERGERLDAKVYTGFLPGWWERHDWHIGAGDADIPAVRIFGNGDSLGRPRERATPPHGNSANLGENEKPIVQPRAILELRVGEAIVAVAPMDAGIPWRATRLLSPCLKAGGSRRLC
jgi:hypothetical protein